MKIKIIILFITILAFISCEDWIDFTPKNSLTFKNGLEDEKDIASAMNLIAQIVRYNVSYTDQISQVQKGCYADSCNISYQQIRELSTTSIVTGIWRHHYKAIAQGNVILHYLDDVNISQERKNWYRGQVYFYNSLIYLDLIRKWGDCVLIDEAIEPQPKAKTPWPIVADHAINFAKEAIELLPELNFAIDENGNNLKYRSTPCKGAANAVLANLAAWKAGGQYFAQESESNYNVKELWDLTEKACSEIIKSSNYDLVANAELICSEVLVGDSKESVFETVNRGYLNEMDAYGGYFVMGGYYEHFPVKPNSDYSQINSMAFKIRSESVYRIYPDDDQRKNAYFYKLDFYADPALQDTTKGFAYPYKWREVATVTETGSSEYGNFYTFDCNKIWWRLADIYLLRAEARYHLGDTEGAISDLNRIRKRAEAEEYHSAEYNGDLKYTIFKEREKELLLEGHRYYDIIRNGYVNSELEGGYKTLSNQDLKDGALFMPVPTTAFTDNPLMRQNIFWSKYL